MKKKHSKRYQEIAKKIETKNDYSLEQALDFFQKNDLKQDNNVEITFTLHKMKSNVITSLRLPFFIERKNNIAIINDNLPREVAKNEKIKLVSLEEIQKIIEKKKKHWDFGDLIASLKYEGKLRPLAKTLGKKGLFPSTKNGTLTDNIVEAITRLEKFKKIKIDKEGGIHYILGKINFSINEMTDNYSNLHKEIINAFQPYSLKAGIIKKITLSTLHSPGIKIQE